MYLCLFTTKLYTGKQFISQNVLAHAPVYALGKKLQLKFYVFTKRVSNITQN